MRFVFTIFVVALLCATPVFAQGFGRFAEEPINAPGAYQSVRDSSGAAPATRLHMFRLEPGACSARRYDNGLSDCDFNSVRAQLFETRQSQPAEAWYSWHMHLPADFPYGRRQAAGGNYSFAYWHNRECPNLDILAPEGGSTLYLQTNTFRGSGQCTPAQRLRLGDLRTLVGGWHQFEVHVRWSAGGDGFANVYIDGEQRASYRGPTITAGTPNHNYFKFGLYLNNTRSPERVTPAWALFTTPERGSTR